MILYSYVALSFIPSPKKVRKKVAEMEIIKDTPADDPLYLPKELEIVAFLGEDEVPISSDELILRAEKLHASLGERQWKFILEHEKDISPKCRDHFLLFLGTIKCDQFKRLRAPVLFWGRRTQKWIGGYVWLDYKFGSNYRLLRFYK